MGPSKATTKGGPTWPGTSPPFIVSGPPAALPRRDRRRMRGFTIMFGSGIGADDARGSAAPPSWGGSKGDRITTCLHAADDMKLQPLFSVRPEQSFFYSSTILKKFRAHASGDRGPSQ
mmetsp:Transcript_6185/g.14268  ORF Transcript_6185/g.14268 Transcript_6185/m.14268 type:complete len:118 (+) Transcript_6185:449-802(+)